jgi:hypothetical protein
MKHDSLQIQKALLTIFGPEHNQLYLPEPSLLKQAYRKKAMLIHPDRSKFTGLNEIRLEEEFKKLTLAYNLLNSLIEIKESYEYKQKPAKKHRYASKHFYHPHYHTYNRDKKIFKPAFKMRLAFFLYRKGIIDWETIIDALIWQMKNRPRVGEIGVKCGYLKREHIYHILRNRLPGEKFLESAQRTGLLDSFKINVLLYLQRSYNLPIGRYFIEKEILTEHELDKLVAEQKEYNLKLRKNRA